MARIFKPTYPQRRTVRDANGQVVMERKIATKGKNKGKEIETKKQEPVRDKDGKPVLKQSKNWYVEYRDANDVVQKVPGYADKRATEQLAAKLERETAQRKTGIIDRFDLHRKRPLQDHINDWREDLLAKGTTPKQADQVVTRARRIIEGCGFVCWGDISASIVQGYIHKLKHSNQKEMGVSAQTRNFYLQAIKQFCRWMISDQRAAESPVAHLKGSNVQVDRRHDRRALEEDELRCLITVTAEQPTRFGLAGSDRAMLYRVAVETGLRVSELRSLTSESFELDAVPPTVTVLASYSKRRRTDVQPIPQALAEELKLRLKGHPQDCPVFKFPEKRAAKMLRADLDAAGIPYVDDAGRFVDFHALRHTFITNLAKGGLPPKLTMDLARHSSFSLTMGRYSHTVVADRASGLDVLPDLSREDHPKRLRATGTCDDDGSADMSLCMSEQNTPHGSRMTSTDTDGGEGGEHKNRTGQCKHEEVSPLTHQLARDDTSIGEGGIRTRGTGLTPYDGLANRYLQPLGHLSSLRAPGGSRTGHSRRYRVAFQWVGCGVVPAVIDHLEWCVVPVEPYEFEDRDRGPAVIEDETFCGACGYALRGLTFIGRCPECGGAYRARGRDAAGIYTPHDLVFPLWDLLACAGALLATSWLIWGLIHGLEFWLALTTLVFLVVTPLYLRHTGRRLNTWRRGRSIVRRVLSE